MNREDIIRMAREAGIANSWDLNWQDKIIERFADLVSSAEREACAKVCEDIGRAEEMQAIGNDYAEAIRARGQA